MKVTSNKISVTSNKTGFTSNKIGVLVIRLNFYKETGVKMSKTGMHTEILDGKSHILNNGMLKIKEKYRIAAVETVQNLTVIRQLNFHL